MRTVNTIAGHTAYLTRTERIRTISAASVLHTARTVPALLAQPLSWEAARTSGVAVIRRLGHLYISAINPLFDNRAITPIIDRIETLTLIPETFSAIAGQILSAEFTAYSSKSPNADILAMADNEEWLGGTELLEYVTISPATYRVQIRCGGAWYDSDTDDADTVSRVLASAAKRIEVAIAATLA